MTNAQETGAELQTLIRASVKDVEGLYIEETSPRSIVLKAYGMGKFVVRFGGKGTLDFVGDFRGRALYFDAKSTKVKTRFNLENIEGHQAKIIRKAHGRGCLAFLLVEFSTLEGGPRYFAMTWDVLGPAWEAYQDVKQLDAPSSIPFKTIAANCLEVKRVKGSLLLVSAIAELASRT